jgi:hypothetical protein
MKARYLTGLLAMIALTTMTAPAMAVEMTRNMPQSEQWEQPKKPCKPAQSRADAQEKAEQRGHPLFKSTPLRDTR